MRASIAPTVIKVSVIGSGSASSPNFLAIVFAAATLSSGSPDRGAYIPIFLLSFVASATAFRMFSGVGKIGSPQANGMTSSYCIASMDISLIAETVMS